jgi:hypothetical protein
MFRKLLNWIGKWIDSQEPREDEYTDKYDFTLDENKLPFSTDKPLKGDRFHIGEFHADVFKNKENYVKHGKVAR